MIYQIFFPPPTCLLRFLFGENSTTHNISGLCPQFLAQSIKTPRNFLSDRSVFIMQLGDFRVPLGSFKMGGGHWSPEDQPRGRKKG